MADKGTVTLTDDQLVSQAAAPAVESAQQSEQPSAFSRIFDYINKGRVSPDAALSFLTLGKQGKGTPQTVSALEKSVTAPPSLSQQPRIVNVPGFGQVDWDRFVAGVRAGEARVASGFTSPASIGTLGLSGLARVPGAIGQASRGLLTATGLGYGAQGAKQAVEGAQEGLSTPGGAEKALFGGSQVASSATAVAEAGRMGQSVMSKIAPELFSKGEGAFVSALAPSKKNVPALREAFRGRQSELSKAPIKDLPDLAEFSSAKRVEAAQELNRELLKINPQATRVDAVTTGNEIRKTITKTMALSSPKEATAIQNYATRVEQEFLRRPIGLGEAEALVQELNARSATFDKLPPEAQRQRLAEGDPILGEKALKSALQDAIESKLSNYRNLKQRYGQWKEIQNQTQARIDDIERKGTTVNYSQRRALESLLSAGGLMEGFRHGGSGLAIAGGFSGYLLGRFAADQLLNRLATPERALQRGIHPPAERPLPFAGQAIGTAAQGAQQ